MHKIPVDELRPGMTLLDCDKTWLNLPIMGSTVEGTESIDILKNYGVEFVFVRYEDIGVEVIDEEQDEDNLKELLLKESEKRSVDAYASSVDEAEQLQRLHKFARKAVKNIFSDIKSKGAVDYDTAKMVVETFVDSCFKRPFLTASLVRLKDFSDYIVTHSINTTILSIALGKKMGMDSDELNIIGLGGLFHDVGKLKIPDHILNKPGKLTPEEFKIMKKHVEYGYEIVKDFKWFPSAAYMCILQHHERSDGTGYPLGLSEHEISKMGKISAVVDVYDAVTSARVYNKGMMPSLAMKMFFGWSGTYFNEVLVKFLVDILGIYPVGTLVLLDTGELAVVFERKKSDPARPVVLVITDSNRNRCNPYLFDLENYNVSTKMSYKSIITPLNNRKYDIDTNDIIEKFLATTQSGG